MSYYLMGKWELRIYRIMIILLITGIILCALRITHLELDVEEEKTNYLNEKKITETMQILMDYQDKYTRNLENLLNQKLVKNLKVTAYLPTGKPTAFGRKPIVGRTVASSRDQFWYGGLTDGTIIYVEGLGVRVIEDLIARKYKGKPIENTIDIYVNTEEEARKIGNGVRKVIILG